MGTQREKNIDWPLWWTTR